jgi:hypothetical protein
VENQVGWRGTHCTMCDVVEYLESCFDFSWHPWDQLLFEKYANLTNGYYWQHPTNIRGLTQVVGPANP